MNSQRPDHTVRKRRGRPDTDSAVDAIVIPVEFGAGQRRHSLSTADSVTSFPEHPKYRIRSGVTAGEGSDVFEDPARELTPRQRRFVDVAAWTLADNLFDAVEDLARHPEAASQDISILSDFPPCTWTQSVSWWREQARCFDDLAAEARAGADPEPRCTGEEMALHLILQRARIMSTDPSDIWTNLIEGIAERDTDGDWDGPLEFLFQDHDVLMLFDTSTEPHSGAVNLEPGEWFTPFGDARPRESGRGFRR